VASLDLMIEALGQFSSFHKQPTLSHHYATWETDPLCETSLIHWYEDPHGGSPLPQCAVSSQPLAVITHMFSMGD
jgi:hypothetical protein